MCVLVNILKTRVGLVFSIAPVGKSLMMTVMAVFVPLDKLTITELVDNVLVTPSQTTACVNHAPVMKFLTQTTPHASHAQAGKFLTMTAMSVHAQVDKSTTTEHANNAPGIWPK